MTSRLRQYGHGSATETPVVLLPGGPCFSSQTLHPLADRLPQANLYLLDPAGAGGTEPLPELSYAALLKDIEVTITSLRRPVVLVGHSFGGLLAAEISVRGNVPVERWIGISSPLTQGTFLSVQEAYLRVRTEEVAALEEQLRKEMTTENMRAWFLSFAHLYFPPATLPRGCRLFAEDALSVPLFLCREPNEETGLLPDRFRKLAIGKTLIAGAKDLVCAPASLRRDAELVAAEFLLVDDGGHFPFLEAGDEVAVLVAGRLTEPYSRE